MLRSARLFVTSIFLSSLVALGCSSTSTDLSATVTRGDEIAAWEAFCDELKAVGVTTLREHPQNHAIDRAEGVRYLAQQIGAAVRDELLEREVSFPLLRLSATTIDKWGMDGADAKYQGSPIDGNGSYRLSGTLGDATLTALQVARMSPSYEAYASLAGSDLGADSDGHFELILSKERPTGWAGAWLPLDPKATLFVVREYFGDWVGSHPATLQLERLDPVPRRPPLGEDDIDGILQDIAQTFSERAPMWLTRSKQMRRFLTNKTPVVDRGNDSGAGLRDNVYGSGAYAIERDEALLIEFDEPEALLWSIQLGNYWWESIDYVTGTGSLNGGQMFSNQDGKVRVIVALEDPGVPNWLDPHGHPEGLFLYRFQQATRSSDPQVRLVKLNTLRKALPTDTPAVTPEERASEIASRRMHATRRWAP